METYNDTYCVYVHTNKINNKKYVGITIHGNNPEKRWKHGNGYKAQKYFYRAIEKYGWDGFEHDIVASRLTEREAKRFEQLLIKKLNTRSNEFGYNCTDGGDGILGHHMTNESKEKRKEKMEKYLSDENYIQKIRDASHKTPVVQFSTNGLFIKAYLSTKDAERCTGVSSAGISKCALGKTPSAGGYIWVFVGNEASIDQRVERYQSSKLRIEPIVQLTLDGLFVAEFKSSAEAERHVVGNYKNINAACRGKKITAYGYKWMYASDYYRLCG